MEAIHSACVLNSDHIALLLRKNKIENPETTRCQILHICKGVVFRGAERSGEAIRLSRLSEASDCVAMLSMNGEVEIFDPSSKSLGREDVTGCLAQGASLPKYGYLLAMSLIGGRLYASGMGGQVYMRGGAEKWHLISEEPCTEISYDRYFVNIQGQSSSQVVVDGLDGDLYLYDGHAWRRIDSGTQAAIGEMVFLDNGEVFITSTQSTLLQGNFEAGFQPKRIGDADQVFLKICAYGGYLYIGSYDGLFRYDIHTRNLVSVSMPSDTKGTEVVSLQLFGRNLWCFTTNAVYIFDGSHWSKFFSL